MAIVLAGNLVDALDNLGVKSAVNLG